MMRLDGLAAYEALWHLAELATAACLLARCFHLSWRLMQRSERVCAMRPSFYTRFSWEQFTRRRKEGEAGETELGGRRSEKE